MSAPRSFTPKDLATAMRLKKDGMAWKTVARSLGRQSGIGIRRQLDEDFRVERNAYHARYRREQRIRETQEAAMAGTDNTSRRSRSQHLTAAEISRLRIAFDLRRSARSIAAEIGCSIRIANKYYSQFSGGAVSAPVKREIKPAARIQQPRPRPVVDRAARFYKGNFELS